MFLYEEQKPGRKIKSNNICGNLFAMRRYIPI